MPWTRTLLRLRDFFRGVSLLSLLSLLISTGCDGRVLSQPLAGAAPGPSPVPAAPSDLQRVVAQTKAHRQKILKQEKRVDRIEASVESLRRNLIEDRFSTLDQLARRKRWGRRPPREGHRDFKKYQEWLFIRERKEQLKLPKRTPKAPPIRVEPKDLSPTKAMIRVPERPKPAPRIRVPQRSPVKKFIPDWVAK